MLISKTDEEILRKRPFLRPNDVVLFLVLILLAVGIFFIASSTEQGLYARVASFEHNVYINLSHNQIFSPEDAPTVLIKIEDGAIAFFESDCPDQVCVHSGFLRRPGQWAACLPNRVLVTILGDGDDIVVR
jgi:hypothetical protein